MSGRYAVPYGKRGGRRRHFESGVRPLDYGTVARNEHEAGYGGPPPGHRGGTMDVGPRGTDIPELHQEEYITPEMLTCINNHCVKKGGAVRSEVC